MAGMESLIMELVYITNNGFSTGLFAKYTDLFTEESFGMIAGCVNALALTCIFGAWFYLVTTLGEVFDLGLKEFIKERSLIIKITSWLIVKTRKKASQFKEEVLHVDLGGEAEGTVRKLVFINLLFLAMICLLWMFGWIALVIYSVVLYIGLKNMCRKFRSSTGNFLRLPGL